VQVGLMDNSDLARLPMADADDIVPLDEGEKVTICFRCPQTLVDQIDALWRGGKRNRKKNRTKIILFFIRRGLERHREASRQGALESVQVSSELPTIADVSKHRPRK